MSPDWIKNYDVEPQKLVELKVKGPAPFFDSIFPIAFWAIVFIVLYMGS